MAPGVAVKHKLLKEKMLPKQPVELNDVQWDLVKRMCAWEPADRIDVSDILTALQELEEDEAEKNFAREWEEHVANQPASEPEPAL